MRKSFALFFILFITLGASAQILEPAKWSYDVSSKEVKIGDEVELIFKAVIDPSWYLYSSDFDPDLGPMLTEFEFTSNDSYALVGEIVPVNPKEKSILGLKCYKNISDIEDPVDVALVATPAASLPAVRVSCHH